MLSDIVDSRTVAMENGRSEDDDGHHQEENPLKRNRYLVLFYYLRIMLKLNNIETTGSIFRS